MREKAFSVDAENNKTFFLLQTLFLLLFFLLLSNEKNVFSLKVFCIFAFFRVRLKATWEKPFQTKPSIRNQTTLHFPSPAKK